MAGEGKARGPGPRGGLDELDVAGKRVLVRVDFNVPMDEGGAIADDTRIRGALPTIRELLERGARAVTLMSHLGRPKGVEEALRLDPLARRLEELLGRKVVKLGASTGPEVERAVAEAPQGSVILLENVRFERGETKGDPELAARYARLGERFVNDAFGTSHRDEASVSGVARLLPSAPGRLLERELAAFARVLGSPERPFVAVLGGAKISDKLPVVKSLTQKVDAMLVGGAMAYTLLEAEGVAIGSSRREPDRLDEVREALAAARARGVRVLLPEDHVIAREISEQAETRVVEGNIPEGWMGLDIGPRTRERFAREIAGARTLFWNGPMGVFEIERFREGTAAVARAVAQCPGYTVVGGGDSVAAIESLGVADRIDHISTGGGASLELLEGRELPGIAALRLSHRG